MQERTEEAVWLTGETPDGLQVYSEATGEFHTLNDAWVTSRYSELGEPPCVEVHTDGDAFTCALDEEVTVRV